MGVDPRWLEVWQSKGLIADTQTPRPLPMFTTEKEFQAAVNELCERHGWKYYHTFDSRRSNPGFPDLIACRGSVMIAAELKVEPNKPTPDQMDWLAALAKTGALTFVWYPSDWQLIVETFGGAER